MRRHRDWGPRVLRFLLALLCADVTAVTPWPDAARLGTSIRPAREGA